MGLDHHVANLAGEPGVPANQATVRDDPAADAGAERHEDEVVDAARRTPLVLGDRGAVRVVLRADARIAQRCTELGAEVRA